jgi:circadian clock protein KaiC
MSDKALIRRLPTGVRGLDDVLDGGLPELSFNLIAGGPGCGKTTLAHQILFANATSEKMALYFTIFGEPPIKMLRYQQQFSFFDVSKINTAIRFVHLGQEMLDGGLARVVERITHELEQSDARVVVVDSFRSVGRLARPRDYAEEVGLESFVQTLALRLTSHEATTFLVGEYLESETNSNPVFTVADGIFWLHQTVARNSVVRQLQVVKMRGGNPAAGLHTLTLTDDGMRVYPRLARALDSKPDAPTSTHRGELKKTGIAGLDEMLGGGIPSGYSVLLAGSSGSGKTVLATHFIAAGLAEGEAAVVATFDGRLQDIASAPKAKGTADSLVGNDRVGLVHLRPLDLSIDETLQEIQEAVRRLGATRVVIDSLSSFELALAPPFRDDFREAIYRVIRVLTALGVTVILTVEMIDAFSVTSRSNRDCAA